ncbi:hypothetical protein [Nafulsella turpanensis]|uniref:hypothetical protein n=1 Tax=Nafulsella turpanensis TaxID=1265690 RepID=UPI00034B12CD|nr:hypothetical protein [Nafulsella turpanensis]
MGRTDIIILSLCVGFLVIGIYEIMNYGLGPSYLWFMISVGFLLYYNYRRRRQEEEQEKTPGKKPGKRKK